MLKRVKKIYIFVYTFVYIVYILYLCSVKDKLNRLNITTMTYKVEYYNKRGDLKKVFFNDDKAARKYFRTRVTQGCECYLIIHETNEYIGANY